MRKNEELENTITITAAIDIILAFLPWAMVNKTDVLPKEILLSTNKFVCFRD